MNIILMILYVVAIWIGLSLLSWLFVVYSVKSKATVLKVAEFDEKLKEKPQLIDVRESSSFKVNHIIGARNMPYQNFLQGKAGLRMDKDIVIVDQDMRTASRVLKQLKKQGYPKSRLFVLNGGLKSYQAK